AIGGTLSAARTDRYLDPPVTENYTNHGSLTGMGVRYDDRPSADDRVHVGWQRRDRSFLVPNERLQDAAGQRQERQGSEDLGHAAWMKVLGNRVMVDVRGVVERLGATLSSNELATPIIVSQDRSFTRGYAGLSVATEARHHRIKAGGDFLFSPVR